MRRAILIGLLIGSLIGGARPVLARIGNQVIVTKHATGGGGVTWTHVQDNSAYNGTNCTTGTSCKFGSNVISGHLITVTAELTSAAVPTDTLGNTYTCPVGPLSVYTVYGCYTVSGSSGADTITIPSGLGYVSMTISENACSSGTPTYDQGNGGANGGGTTSPSSGNVTTGYNNELLDSGMSFGSNPGTVTGEAGWTPYTNQSTEGLGQYDLNVSMGTYASTWTLGTSTAIAGITIMTFHCM